MKKSSKRKLARHWKHAEIAWRVAAFLISLRGFVKSLE